MAGRRIGGPHGGSDKGSKGGGALIAVIAAVAIGAGGATAGGIAAVGGTGLSSGPSSGSNARGGRDSTAAQARLVAKGVRVAAKLTDDSSDCAANSYGQVQDFFRRNPCTALHRGLLELRDPKGDAALVAVAWVEMPTEAGARALKTLLDGSGTGNVTELSREKGRYRTVRYTGTAYASRLDKRTVANAQAEPVARGWSGLALASVVTNTVG